MRVLVIDDDVAHGETVTDLLNTKGHEAFSARSLPDARWLIDLFDFQLAIVDYDMPLVKGSEVARELQARLPNLKAVVMSAREPHEGVREDLGPLPYLRKPIRIEELLETIRQLHPPPSGSALVRRVSFSLVRFKGKK